MHKLNGYLMELIIEFAKVQGSKTIAWKVHQENSRRFISSKCAKHTRRNNPQYARRHGNIL